jgi:hypothetical protein
MRTFDAHDREIFLDVAWQEFPATRQLTPETRPRTLREVGRQVESQFGSFYAIAKSKGIAGSLRPEWFAKSEEIEAEGWNWEKFIPPWLVLAAPAERRHSERTALYVLEGNHSMAVLAHGLTANQLTWRPLEAVVCLASREEVDRVLDGRLAEGPDHALR